MVQRIIDLKTWHEVITDDMDWELVELGAVELARRCVNPPVKGVHIEDFEHFCKHVIARTYLPDGLSYNDAVKILRKYLEQKWEEYKING